MNIYVSWLYKASRYNYFTTICVEKKQKKLHCLLMPKTHELIDFQKREIIALEPQFSHAKISMQLNIQWPTVTKFLQCFKNHKSIKNLPRSNWLRKTSKTRDWWIVHNAESQTCVPLRVLKDILNIDISKWTTIQWRLREVGIWK